MLTVDSITGGNRERDKRTGFAIPFRLNLAGIAQFMAKPGWALNYFTHERFRLPQLDGHVDMGGGVIHQPLFHRDAGSVHDLGRRGRDGRALGRPVLPEGRDVGRGRAPRRHRLHRHRASNHGGRQLDGSRSAFDQLAEIVDAVGDRIDVMMDGGVQRGTHVLKALSLGAKAVGLGRYYLFPLAAAGQREWSARWI